MIIKRKYACYYQLMDEPESKGLLLDSFKAGGVDVKRANELLQLNGSVIVCNTDMGSCIPASISGIVHYSSRKGNAIMQVLYNCFFDNPARIVQVIAFEHNLDSIRPVKPWDVGQIII